MAADGVERDGAGDGARDYVQRDAGHAGLGEAGARGVRVKVNSAARTVDSVAVSGSTVTLTLATAVSDSDTVTVSYTKPSSGEKALQDHDGANDVASFTDQAVSVATTPTVTGVAVTSDPGGTSPTRGATSSSSP